MIPDDTAGRPLTPGEQAVIADLERRFLLDSSVPVRERVAVRAAGVGSTARPGPTGARQTAGPLLALLGTALALVAAVVVVGGGPLGVAAVLVSVVATALAWPLLPVALGGPVRPARPPYRSRGAVRRHP
ncbi:MAG TPA: hypothetical protein VF667_05825 [Pseudonocardia sp.]